MEYVTVQDTEIPALGLGTWRMKGPTCRRAVATALARMPQRALARGSLVSWLKAQKRKWGI